MQWFYQHCSKTLARSRDYRSSLTSWGISSDRLAVIPPSVDSQRFSASHAKAGLASLGIKEQFSLLYAGRLSIEKNLSFLANLFKRLCARRRDISLVLVGDGPYRRTLQDDLRELPAYFPGPQNDEILANLYASADLFLFPSTTDTLGQVVMEAQSCGLPVLVSNQGGPKEIVDDGLTGLVLPSNDQDAWLTAIESLLADSDRRHRMSRAASQRMARHTQARTFEAFWSEHLSSRLATPQSHPTGMHAPHDQGPQSETSRSVPETGI
jgi:glycosyltransferase involved in cell wall biosynthesis